MKLLTSYCLAGLIFFTAGTAFDHGIGLQEQLSEDHAALPMSSATSSPEVEVFPLSADKAISDALALHGNHQRIPSSIFMGRNGVDPGLEPRDRYLVQTGPCRRLCDRAEDAP